MLSPKKPDSDDGRNVVNPDIPRFDGQKCNDMLQISETNVNLHSQIELFSI